MCLVLYVVLMLISMVASVFRTLFSSFIILLKDLMAYWLAEFFECKERERTLAEDTERATLGWAKLEP